MFKVDIKKAVSGFNIAVTFEIQQEILAILGPSGSGKTMTLKCIAGLLKPDEGFIELNGKVLFDSTKGVSLPAQKRKVGFVFQNYALFPHLTVEQNVGFGIRHLPHKDADERISWLLNKMHIQGLGKRFPRQLSSGQQQRVALARALSHEPELLLLDEPFSALDTPRKERLEIELLELQDFYKGDILFVTHDLSQGYKLGSKIAVYESGHIVQCDSKHHVISSPANRTVARLTGVTNLIEGSVCKIEGLSVWVLLPDLNITIHVQMKNEGNLAINQGVLLGIRPEYVRIVDYFGENVIPVKPGKSVEGVTSLSYICRPVVDSSGRYDIEVSLPRIDISDKSVSQPRYLYLPPEHTMIIQK